MKIRLDRWFLIHAVMMLFAGTVAFTCLSHRAEALEQYPAVEASDQEDSAEDTTLPQSIPLGFTGFEHTIVLGHEAEALEELEADTATYEAVK